MPSYKLTYFNIRWYGEGARLLFNYAGVPFEDIRISNEQWFQLKPKMPYGQVPVLEVDGHMIAQSAAIYRYLGHQFNLAPKSPIDDANVDAVYDSHKDFHAEIKPFIACAAGFAPGDKKKLEKEVVCPARDKYFGYLKRLLSKTDGTHLIGDQVYWADIVIADNLSVINFMVPSLFESHSEVKKFVDYIHQLPKLQKYLKERPESQF
uniref:glutathione transferase n=1 Tax=Syphacia muris TaxID=451379 RepID=A0A0N5AN66_9BILA